MTDHHDAPLRPRQVPPGARPLPDRGHGRHRRHRARARRPGGGHLRLRVARPAARGLLPQPHVVVVAAHRGHRIVLREHAGRGPGGGLPPLRREGRRQVRGARLAPRRIRLPAAGRRRWPGSTATSKPSATPATTSTSWVASASSTSAERVGRSSSSGAATAASTPETRGHLRPRRPGALDRPDGLRPPRRRRHRRGHPRPGVVGVARRRAPRRPRRHRHRRPHLDPGRHGRPHHPGHPHRRGRRVRDRPPRAPRGVPDRRRVPRRLGGHRAQRRRARRRVPGRRRRPRPGQPPGPEPGDGARRARRRSRSTPSTRRATSGRAWRCTGSGPARTASSSAGSTIRPRLRRWTSDASDSGPFSSTCSGRRRRARPPPSSSRWATARCGCPTRWAGTRS